MQRKIPWLKISIISVILLILIPGTLLWIKEKKQPETLVLAHRLPKHLSSAVESQIRHFDSISPEWEVQIISDPSGEDLNNPQLFRIDQSYPADESTPGDRRIFWTGKNWFLAINTAVLDDGIILPEAFFDPDELEAFFATLKDQKITPLAIGNSHGWPLALWVQHLEQAGASSDGEIPESWYRLKTWYREGYLEEDTLGEGWSKGVASVVEGNAAMVMINGTMISSIPRNQRKDFEFRNFPRGSAEKPWLIGTGYLLYYNSTNEGFQALADYLLSPAVCDILTRETGQLFQPVYSGERDFLTGWDSRANTPEGRSYNRRLADFVTSEE